MSVSHQQHLCSRKIKITGLVIQKCLCLAASSWGSQKPQEPTGKSSKLECCRKDCSGSWGVLQDTGVIFRYLACKFSFLAKGCSGSLSSGIDSQHKFKLGYLELKGSVCKGKCESCVRPETCMWNLASARSEVA